MATTGAVADATTGAGDSDAKQSKKSNSTYDRRRDCGLAFYVFAETGENKNMNLEAQSVSRGEHYRMTVLENGIRVLSERIPSVRSISVGAFVPTGSRDEDVSTNGICHFIEHMVFKGTNRRRMHHIARRMESVGGYLNAFTSKEYTCFFARSLDEHLPRAVDILGDIILQPVFPEKEIEKEKGVVLDEISMYEDVPEEVVFDLFERLLYPNHSLGRPILGLRKTVTSFTREQLSRHLAAHYWTDKMIFAASGNVDHTRFVRCVRRAFTDNSLLVQPSERMSAPPNKPNREVIEKQGQQGHVVMGVRALPASDERRVALTLLNTILGSGMSSRLNHNIRERYGFCYNIYSFVNYLTDTGEFGIYAGTEPGRINRLQQLVFRELRKLSGHRVGNRTLTQAKNQLKGALMLGLEDLSARMIRLAKMEYHFGRYFSLDESLALIDDVNSEEIRSLAEILFEQSGFSIATVVPPSNNSIVA